MSRNALAPILGRDLGRYGGGVSLKAFARHYVLTPGFRYTFWMRAARHFKSGGVLTLIPYVISRWILRRLRFKFGIDIPYNTDIGPGLYIGHFGGIVVNHEATVGEDCNINHGVTIGATYGGPHAGVPVLGSRVYLGPGSKVIGAIEIGDDVAVGANAVVTRSVPDGSVVAGIPAEVISQKGSSGYVVHTGNG